MRLIEMSATVTSAAGNKGSPSSVPSASAAFLPITPAKAALGDDIESPFGALVVPRPPVVVVIPPAIVLPFMKNAFPSPSPTPSSRALQSAEAWREMALNTLKEEEEDVQSINVARFFPLGGEE